MGFGTCEERDVGRNHMIKIMFLLIMVIYRTSFDRLTSGNGKSILKLNHQISTKENPQVIKGKKFEGDRIQPLEKRK